MWDPSYMMDNMGIAFLGKKRKSCHLSSKELPVYLMFIPPELYYIRKATHH